MPLGAFRLNTLAASMAIADAGITATGGTVTTQNIGGTFYKVHTFTTTGSNSFTVTAGSGTVDVLLVGGGGGTAGGYSGFYVNSGAGGGGVVYQTGVSVTAQTYSLSVGAGGTGGGSTSTAGNPGGSTTGFSFTAGGGTGSGASNSGRSGSPQLNNAGASASSFSNPDFSAGGGGGGAGGVGTGFTNSGQTPGNGGSGLANSITGTSVLYAPGGGGAGNFGSGSAGSGSEIGKGATNNRATAGVQGNAGAIIIRYVDPTGGSDAPTIPLASFGSGTIQTTTERSVNSAKSMPFLGQRNGYWFWGGHGMSTGTSQRVRQQGTNFTGTNGFAQSIATGTTGQQTIASSGVISLNNASGGQSTTLIGSPTNVRFRTSVAGGTAWSSNTIIPTTTTVGGTIGTSQARSFTSAYPDIAMAHSPISGTLYTHRPLMCWTNTISSVKYLTIAVGTQASGSTTLTTAIALSAGTTVANTTGSAIHVDACGFTGTDANNYRYCAAWVEANDTYSLKFFTVNTSTLSTVTSVNLTVPSGNVNESTVDAIWDDFANGKFVAVACSSTSTTTYVQAYSVTAWGTGAAPTVTTFTQQNLGVLLPNAQIHSTGKNGLGFITYTNSGFTEFRGRFISVSSTNGVMTLGDEIVLGATQTGAYVSYGAGGGIDASGAFCIGFQGSNHVGGGSNSGWNMYKTTTAI
jgi:hypothetical protein